MADVEALERDRTSRATGGGQAAAAVDVGAGVSRREPAPADAAPTTGASS